MILRAKQKGFTLVELVVVLMIMGVLAGVAANRIQSVFLWKQRESVRLFANTWEFLAREAQGKSEAYRLILDLDQHTYYVRREVPLQADEVRQVDYLENLRSKSERERRAEERRENIKSIEEEFVEEDIRQSATLDRLFYQTMYPDGYGSIRLGLPIDFPELGEQRRLVEGVRFRDVSRPGITVTEGETFIRFSPQGVAEAVAIHLQIEETEDQTVFINPATGRVQVKLGYHELERPERNEFGSR